MGYNKIVRDLFQMGCSGNANQEEVTLERSLIVAYVKQLFKRADFPQEILVAVNHTINVKKGDVVFASSDCEDAYDFMPLPRIDELITNLPSKEEFLKKLGVQEMEEVTPEGESKFWDEFEFQFAESACGVKIIWI